MASQPNERLEITYNGFRLKVTRLGNKNYMFRVYASGSLFGVSDAYPTSGLAQQQAIKWVDMILKANKEKMNNGPSKN